MFELLTECMRNQDYKPYRIQGLGLFEVKPYMRKKYETAKLRREAREEHNREVFNNLPD